jgi:hypothetical protein
MGGRFESEADRLGFAKRGPSPIDARNDDAEALAQDLAEASQRRIEAELSGRSRRVSAAREATLT